MQATITYDKFNGCRAVPSATVSINIKGLNSLNEIYTHLKNRNFDVYRGGSHVAWHNNGERVLIITEQA